jgi:cell division protein FtsI/penicillin-binding protein 2
VTDDEPRRRPAEASARAAAGRAKAVFYAFVVLACLVIARYFVVQVREGPTLAERGYRQRLTTVNFAAQRGTIFDRDGEALVRSLPSQSVYATTAEITNVDREAHALAAILPDVSVADVTASLRDRAPYIQVDHKIGRAQADAIARLALPGISIVPETTGVRFDPSGRLASTVLGFTGFTENGLAGVEFAYDDLLHGTPGEMQLEGDEFGRAIPFAQPHVVVAAKPGHSLVLTLDSYLQNETERVLRDTVARWHAQSGSAIVMNPWTGEILALANAPDYDVAHYGRFSPDARRDRAVEDAYEPGSVFKLVTAAAALDSGKVSPDDRFPARDRLAVGGYTIYNAEDGFLAGSSDSENLEEIIEKSHNVGAAEVGLRIGSRTMFDALVRFGFGEKTRVGLPGESRGIVPELATWSATTLPTIAFGQGISTTPIAIARAYCAIANGGLLLRPRIVAEILDADGHVTTRYETHVERRAIGEGTAAILRSYLRAVVTRGTGNPTAQVPGYTTAGKTGTAQIAENGHYAAGAYVASFVGMIPAERPKFVILVKIERPRGSIYGGVVAAPAFAELAKIAMMHAGVLPVGPRLVRAERIAKRRS